MQFYITDLDLTKEPIPHSKLKTMRDAGARFWHNYETGQVYISQQYWSKCPEVIKEALRRLVVGGPTELDRDERLVKAVEDQLAQEASEKEASHE